MWRTRMRHMAYSVSTHRPGQQTHTVSPGVRIFLDLTKKGEVANPYVAMLGLKTFETKTLHHSVVVGLKFTTFEKLQRIIEISPKDLAKLVRISPRNLYRRREQGRLEPTESDRVLAITRVFGLAIELFDGDEGAARAWLLSPQRGLGSQRPIDLLQTDVGSREVESLIGRLEHGVFS